MAAAISPQPLPAPASSSASSTSRSNLTLRDDRHVKLETRIIPKKRWIRAEERVDVPLLTSLASVAKVASSKRKLALLAVHLLGVPGGRTSSINRSFARLNGLTNLTLCKM